jgi:shikimate kinase
MIETRLREQEIQVTFLLKHQNEYNSKILRDLNDVKVIEFPEIFEDLTIERSHLKTESKKQISRKAIHFYFKNIIFNALRVLARRIGRDLSFGRLDKLTEQLIIHRTLFRAEKIKAGLSVNGIDIESDSTIFLMETDRGSSFERPLLFLRSKNDLIRVVLLELADSAIEKDLIKFAKESSRKPILNRYKRRHMEQFKNQIYEKRLYLEVPEMCAWEILGIGSDFPWRIGLNRAVDLTLLRRNGAIAEYEKYASYQEKYKYIGDPISDFLLAPLNTNYSNSMNSDLRILLAMPQYLVTQREFRYSFQKEEYIKRILLDLVEALSRIASSVTIVLHPKLIPKDYLSYQKFSNVKLSFNSIHEEISRHNCMVSTGGSSVTKFAWLLKMPVLVYLPQKWKLRSLYAKVESSRPWTEVITRSEDLLKLELSDFFNQAKNYYESKEYVEELKSELWDGKSSERFVSEIHKLFSQMKV